MKSVRLSDGLDVFCLSRPEAIALDDHVSGYFRHGVEVGEGATVLDVGANIGLFAMRVMERTKGSGRVFAFEPLKPVFEVMSRNAAKFDDRITPVQAALGTGPGTLQVTYFPRCPSLSSAHEHLWNESPGGLATAVERAMEHPPKGYELASRWLPAWSMSLIARFMVAKRVNYDCPMTSVSAFIRERELQHIDLLKVDVEGAEADVLAGVEDADWQRVKSCVVEVHDVSGRLETMRQRLAEVGLTRQAVEVEPGFVGTHLKNLYATRPN